VVSASRESREKGAKSDQREDVEDVEEVLAADSRLVTEEDRRWGGRVKELPVDDLVWFSVYSSWAGFGSRCRRLHAKSSSSMSLSRWSLDCAGPASGPGRRQLLVLAAEMPRALSNRPAEDAGSGSERSLSRFVIAARMIHGTRGVMSGWSGGR
jgi:hypothetical protein